MWTHRFSHLFAEWEIYYLSVRHLKSCAVKEIQNGNNFGTKDEEEMSESTWLLS